MRNLRKVLPWLVIFVVGIVVLTASRFERAPAVPMAGEAIEAADYAVADNWLHVPEGNALPVDIFWLYPTVWSMNVDEPYPVSPIDSPLMRRGATELFNRQATLFASAGNLYAPYYRLLDASFLLGKSEPERSAYTEGVPGHDVAAAFDYYIRHYNEGRPFILMGHSQGATMIKSLLFGYLKEHPELVERMVAAYVVGYSVTREELAKNTHVRFAEGADDIGVILSWNTEAPGTEGESPTVLPGSVAINPLTWTKSEDYAAASLNLGTLRMQDGQMMVVPGLADARVNLARGTVVCGSMDPMRYGVPPDSLFPQGSFHFNDVSFYVGNIRANMTGRTQRWFSGR